MKLRLPESVAGVVLAKQDVLGHRAPVHGGIQNLQIVPLPCKLDYLAKTKIRMI